MSLGIIVFLVGLFGVPIALLLYGHRVRRRGARAQRIFIGAFIGHCVAGVVATVWGMIPPDAWTSGETGRGFAGLWSLLVFPVAGAVAGAISARQAGGTQP